MGSRYLCVTSHGSYICGSDSDQAISATDRETQYAFLQPGISEEQSGPLLQQEYWVTLVQAVLTAMEKT